MWEGIDQIAPGEAAHLGRSYEFTFEETPARTAQVRVVNGSGQCSTDGFLSITGDEFGGECSIATACTAKLSYEEDGTVHSEALYDQFGNLLEKLQYTSPSAAEFVDAVFPMRSWAIWGSGSYTSSVLRLARFKDSTRLFNFST